MLVLGGLSLVTTGQSPAQAQDFGTVRPLTQILDNREGSPWSAVRLAAAAEAEHNLGPKHRNIPTAVPFYAVFEGPFIPAANTTRLALHTDDGSNLYIDGVLVHQRLGLGQNLSNLDITLYAIDVELEAGRSYDIRLEYSNVYHFGPTDVDGATLFAYTYDPNQDRPFSVWRAGNPINCGGMRWPFAGATIKAGTVGKLSAFLATDFDQRDTTFEGVTETQVLSDPCSYTWEVSGGTLAKNKGQGVDWLAPATPGTYTIRLRVDDQWMANQPTYEGGQRLDPFRSFNDAPQLYSVTVNVTP